jgi:hypothetical protein
MGSMVALPRRAATVALALLVLVPLVHTPRAHAAFVDVGFGLVDSFTVDTTSPAGQQSTVLLRKGREYAVDVSGTFTYGVGTADAECSTATNDATWKAQRYTGQFGDSTADWLDLYVGGAKVTWKPATGTDACDPTTHHYRIDLIPAETGRLQFAVRDTFYGDNSGSLRVTVFIVGGTIFAGLPGAPV